MAGLFRVKVRAFIGGRLVEPGDIVAYTGKRPGPALEPVPDAAGAPVKRTGGSKAKASPKRVELDGPAGAAAAVALETGGDAGPARG